jgi:hypothetical protein
VIQKEGAVYIKAEEAKVKAGKRLPIASCKATGEDNVLIVGGYGLLLDVFPFSWLDALTPE